MRLGYDEAALARAQMWKAARELFGRNWCRETQEMCEEAQRNGGELRCSCASIALERLPPEAFE